MDIRHFDRAALSTENSWSQRLLPWPTLNAPFEGAQSVIRAGSASPRHAHHEYEIFIAVKGEAWIESHGERLPFVAGDIVHFPPGKEHQVINETDTDFEMFSIWWDTDMSRVFSARHESEA
ncbi:cupin domain-containing protein [Streptomyces sp. LaPpAH-108]|uniref:cupin domain-containing protein n=1 Tax=Streptomyces sp. LaPpAH-108 TaxID=1155714 RepID=UPI00037F2B3E|nr:cupin domain-containing protein [Streptomyces sp. LaPpAH-108]